MSRMANIQATRLFENHQIHAPWNGARTNNLCANKAYKNPRGVPLNPETLSMISVSRYRASSPEARFLLPETTRVLLIPVPCFLSPVSDSRNLFPNTWNLIPKAWNLSPRGFTRFLKPVSCILKPEDAQVIPIPVSRNLLPKSRFLSHRGTINYFIKNKA